MSKESEKKTIKDLFKEGNTPTQENFGSLIDYASNAEILIGKLDDENLPDAISAGKLQGKITTENLPDTIAATKIDGKLAASNLPDTIAATKIDGKLAAANLPDTIAATKIDGKLAAENLPDTIAATKIEGRLAAENLPDTIAATKIEGKLAAENLPNTISATKLTTGTLNNARMPAEIDLTQKHSASTIKAASIIGDGSALTNLLETIFEFEEDAGQDVTINDVPEGKILALYTDIENVVAPE